MPDIRLRHHRTRDHIGVEQDSYVVLSERLGPYEEGTPVKFVLADLVSRLVALETSVHFIRSLTVDAVILGPGGSIQSPSGTFRSVFHVDSIIMGIPSGSFTVNARLTRGASFTVNAWLRGGGSFTIQAIIV